MTILGNMPVIDDFDGGTRFPFASSYEYSFVRLDDIVYDIIHYNQVAKQGDRGVIR